MPMKSKSHKRTKMAKLKIAPKITPDKPFLAMFFM